MKINTVVIHGVFASPLPEACPPGFTVSRIPFPPRWYGAVDGSTIDVFTAKNTALVTIRLPESLDTIFLNVNTLLTRIDLPEFKEAEISHMVATHESGIHNPHFDEKTELDTTRERRHLETVARIQTSIARLQANREKDAVHGNAHKYSERIARCNDKIAKEQDKLNKHMQTYERITRAGESMRMVILKHGKCMVHFSGKWMFVGAKSMAQLEEDHAMLAALVVPLPPIADLQIHDV
jgi:hypothetical protein